jgi:uncharacterized protein YqhQ
MVIYAVDTKGGHEMDEKEKLLKTVRILLIVGAVGFVVGTLIMALIPLVSSLIEARLRGDL